MKKKNKKDKVKGAITELLTGIEKKKGVEIHIVTSDTGAKLLEDALEYQYLKHKKKNKKS